MHDACRVDRPRIGHEFETVESARLPGRGVAHAALLEERRRVREICEQSTVRQRVRDRDAHVYICRTVIAGESHREFWIGFIHDESRVMMDSGIQAATHCHVDQRRTVSSGYVDAAAYPVIGIPLNRDPMRSVLAPESNPTRRVLRPKLGHAQQADACHRVALHQLHTEWCRNHRLGDRRIDAVVDQQPSIDCAFNGDRTHPKSLARPEPVLSKDPRTERQFCVRRGRCARRHRAAKSRGLSPGQDGSASRRAREHRPGRTG